MNKQPRMYVAYQKQIKNVQNLLKPLLWAIFILLDFSGDLFVENINKTWTNFEKK